MGDTNALRQKRYKYHKRGDHSLCVVGRCEEITPKDRVNALGPQGRAVWDGVIKHDKLTAIQNMLLLEFCRTVDRLDQLNGTLTGQPMAEWALDDTGTVATVMVTDALGEARKLQGSLKILASELRLSGLTGGLGNEGGDQPKRGPGRPRKEPEEPVAPPAQTEGGAGDASIGTVTDIATRIAAVRSGQTPN